MPPDCSYVFVLLSLLAAASCLDLRLEPAEQGRIRIHITAPTNGYVGLGFSLDGRLQSSDVVMAWVEDDGQTNVFDGHGVAGRSVPEKDHVQNYKVVEGRENATHTTIILERPWDTCDRKGDLAFVNDTMRLIWTESEHDPNAFGWGAIEWSGPRSILIGNAENKSVQEKAKYWDVLAQDFSLPNTPSFHWCKIYKVPPLARKHHIVGYSPLIEEGHSTLIAKMVLYECLGGPKFEEFGSHPGAACHDNLMPLEWNACHTPVVVWATGAQGQLFPDHIGLPMAEGEGKSTYFMLEIHYDNPALQRVRDSSGLRLYYSGDLRKYDSSILATGISPNGAHIIPPRQARFTSRGYCDSQCTNLMFPETGIKIVAVSFHTHSAGRQVRLRHIREGKELQVIAQDRYFDPGYQQAKQLSTEVIVLPGDDLVTECSYSTVNRSWPTLGGQAVKEETCLAYLQYYPRTALASCTSMTQAEFFFETFGIKEFYHQKMEEVEKIMLNQAEKPLPKVLKKTPMQSLFFRFTEKEGFNIDHKNPYIQVDGSEEDSLFSELVINKPEEFQNKSFMSHLKDLPWSERLFTQRVEEILNQGKFRTFCRLQDSTPAMPSSIYRFPNVTVANETRHMSSCRRERAGDFPNTDGSISITPTHLLIFTSTLLIYFSV